MFLDDKDRRRQASKWIIGVVAACILIYLGVRHIHVIASAVSWLANLFLPMLIGLVMALILNVPLTFLERYLFAKAQNPKLQKLRRPLAILLSLALVLGIFIGVAVLVIPELVNAVTVIVQNIGNAFEQLAARIKTDLELWFQETRSSLVNAVLDTVTAMAGILLDLFVGLIFSIYFLSGKEKLQRQLRRLIRVWFPEQFGNHLIHVASVCNGTFQCFVAGQTTEAIILGSLCAVGMLVLGLPYAPMIGALVGVTAFIPIVGAYVGAFIGAFMILTVNPFQAVVFLVFLTALQQFEGNVIYPRVVGSKINLPAVWVLAAITVGGGLAGPVGMLLGVPAASAGYALLREATTVRERKLIRIIDQTPNIS